MQTGKGGELMMRRAERPSVAELQNPKAYTLLTTLQHTAVAKFVAEYYQQRRTAWILAHYALQLGVIVAWIAVGQMAGLSAESFILIAIASVIGSIVLVPVHEAIHGLAYRLLGATDVRFALSLRKLYAYAIADRFVVDRSEFSFVALLPFVSISVIIVLAAIALEPYRAFLLGVLFFHTSGTSGDWAIVNYLRLNVEHELYSYDDADKRESYFYARN
jgi:putative zincin peptidase